MKKIFSLVAISMFVLGSASAQNFIHPITATQPDGVKTLDSVKILAVMVEFQKDDFSNTFGNGKFGSIYSKDYGNEIIDPLPHNADYFLAHLSFAKDYYAKASEGKLNVSYNLLPQTFTVTGDMLKYSPQVNSTDLAPVADFTKEVWQLVDSTTNVDFSQYNLFLIFHAGVGRDVSLPGSIGLERDLPSVFMSDKAYKKIYGDSFTGFSVNNGNYFITNSAILPETESRELSLIGSSTLIELSINGLLVSNIASFLGLPDLFDTETGKSAIGRFGLMDGQAIFAYGGLFPPMLSAWEKMYLGWINPTEATNSGVYSIQASKGIIKIPLSANEYFLVENRNRDVKGDGAVLTIWQNGTTKNVSFATDTDGFYSYDVSALQGVITSVDEYDWALPGSGIVVWHIDQKVIDENLASNTINVNKEHRGVDVEEADGIQDIGEEFQTIFGDVIIGEGDSVDLWYASNPAELYKNRFDENSKPNTNSNYGGKSLISMFDFSEAGQVMTFSLNIGGGIITGSQSFNIGSGFSDMSIKPVSYNDSLTVFANYSNKIEEYNLLTQTKKSDSIASSYSPSIIINNNKLFVAGAKDNQLNVMVRSSAGDEYFSFQAVNGFSTKPVWLKDSALNKLNLLIGTVDGMVINYEFVNNAGYQFVEKTHYSVQSNTAISNLASAPDYSVFSAGRIVANSDGMNITLNSDVTSLALTQNSNGEYIGFALLDDGAIYSLDASMNSRKIGGHCSSFAIGDVKDQGENNIVYISGKYLYVTSLSGAVLNNFPFENSLGYDFNGTPVLADLNDDGKNDILISDTKGNLFAIDGERGTAIAPTPISIGVPLSSNLSAIEFAKENKAVFVSSNGELITWTFNSQNAGVISWGLPEGDITNSAFVKHLAASNNIKEFSPNQEIYNWPNPVYGGNTYIHYYSSEDADVEINIFDLAGNLVQKLNNIANGGMYNQTAWNTDNVESGVYFANVKLTSVSGKSAEKIIKIAVIH